MWWRYHARGHSLTRQEVVPWWVEQTRVSQSRDYVGQTMPGELGLPLPKKRKKGVQ